jgi:hypothetical protein
MTIRICAFIAALTLGCLTATAGASAFALTTSPNPVTVGNPVTVDLTGDFTDLLDFQVTIDWGDRLALVSGAANPSFPGFDGPAPLDCVGSTCPLSTVLNSTGPTEALLGFSGNSGSTGTDALILELLFDAIGSGAGPVAVSGFYDQNVSGANIPIPLTTVAVDIASPAVPEPGSTLPLLAGALALLLLWRHRRARQY